MPMNTLAPSHRSPLAASASPPLAAPPRRPAALAANSATRQHPQSDHWGSRARCAVEVRRAAGRVGDELRSKPGWLHQELQHHRRPWSFHVPATNCSTSASASGTIDARDPGGICGPRAPRNRECDVSSPPTPTAYCMVPAHPRAPIVYDLVAFDPAIILNRRSVAIERATLGLAVRCFYRPPSLRIRTPPRTRSPHTNLGRPSERRSRYSGRAPALIATLDAAEAAELPPPGFRPRRGRSSRARICRAWSRPTAGCPRHSDTGTRSWSSAPLAGRRGEHERIALAGERCTLLGDAQRRSLAEAHRRCAVFGHPLLGRGLRAARAGWPRWRA